MVSDPTVLSGLQEGRSLYIAHCGSCHNLYHPQTFTQEKWTHQMEEMKVKAQLSDAQAGLILNYLVSAPAGKR